MMVVSRRQLAERKVGMERVGALRYDPSAAGLHDGAFVVVTYVAKSGPTREIVGTVVAANREEVHVLQTGGYRESWWPEMVTLDFVDAVGPIGTVRSWAAGCESCGGSGRA
jgi:hypothetical protein